MIDARADLCSQVHTIVYGGRLDAWTEVLPGAWTGDTWPCPGVRLGADLGARPDDALVLRLTCTCGCHRGEFEHELPPWARRTAVHPTAVLADPDERTFHGGGG